MKLHFDEDLVEAAVLLCTSGRRKGVAAMQIARFNRDREKLYAILDPDDRNAAFFKLHLEWFREWGMETLLTEPLAGFPLLSGGLKLLAFRKSQGKRDDGAELYVNEACERHGVLSISPELLVREPQLAAFLRHELTHLHDMIDPTFGYVPELALTGPSMSQQRLARERYRLLWDISIDGRLSRQRSTAENLDPDPHPGPLPFRTGEGDSLLPFRTGEGGDSSGKRVDVPVVERRWLEFAVGFAFWSEAQQKEVFEALWTDRAPTHQRLEQLVCDPRQLQAKTEPRPGGSCPLCGFPTFAWAESAALRVNELAAIQAEFPLWLPQQGVCARCASMYRVSSSQKLAML